MVMRAVSFMPCRLWITLFIAGIQAVAAVVYTTPGDTFWPSRSAWVSELGDRLSTGASLYNHMSANENTYQNTCSYADTYDWVHGGRGLCVFHDECEYRFCNLNGNDVDDLPAYTLDPRTVGDIQLGLQFANKYNIPVSIKTSGHSFTGSSTFKDSLNIWMVNYPKDGTIKTSYRDSCQTQHTTIGINGGEVWNDVFQAVGRNYHVLSGDTRSVSAAGGWLQGVGLSHTSRFYGLGIDNVVSFEVVLPSGEFASADACKNKDLFWALRGGGGGTFGVVTHVEYKLHPKTKVTRVDLEVEGRIGAIRLFLDYWARKTPTFDRRVAGAWFEPRGAEIYVIGDESAALELVVTDYRTWLSNTLAPAGFRGNVVIDEDPSWYDQMGGAGDYNDFGGRPRRHGATLSSRLVPQDMVVNQRKKVVDFLVDLRSVEYWGAYWLGGIVNDVDEDATAVHPVMRRSIWAISTITSEASWRVRRFLPNSISGASFNHHYGGEPSWRTALWGKHYNRLLQIKNKYDPDRRLNCWHCVGYQGPEYQEVDPDAVPVFCFSGNSEVVVSGKAKKMRDIKLGDKVLVDEHGTYDTVYSFGHYSPSSEADLLQIKSGPNVLEISGQHLVFVQEGNNGRLTSTPASNVKVGDVLAGGANKVTHISSRQAKGLYAPFTFSGRIMVNNVLASNYITLEDSNPKFCGLVSYHWMAHSFSAPHRLHCKFVSNCNEESYSEEGISTWVSFPHEVGLWIMRLNAGWRFVVLLPLLFVLLCVWALERIVESASTVVAALVVCVISHRYMRMYFKEKQC